jgi:hypothetical protein
MNIGLMKLEGVEDHDATLERGRASLAHLPNLRGVERCVVSIQDRMILH